MSFTTVPESTRDTCPETLPLESVICCKDEPFEDDFEQDGDTLCADPLDPLACNVKTEPDQDENTRSNCDLKDPLACSEIDFHIVKSEPNEDEDTMSNNSDFLDHPDRSIETKFCAVKTEPDEDISDVVPSSSFCAVKEEVFEDVQSGNESEQDVMRMNTGEEGVLDKHESSRDSKDEETITFGNTEERNKIITDSTFKTVANQICDNITDQVSFVKRYINIHSGENCHSCINCDYRTDNLNDLTRHVRKNHKATKYHSCNECDYTTNCLHVLKRHMSTHSGYGKPHCCSICRFKTSCPNSLKHHMMIHTGEKPYSCNECDYRARRPATLKCHMRVHTR